MGLPIEAESATDEESLPNDSSLNDSSLNGSSPNANSVNGSSSIDADSGADDVPTIAFTDSLPKPAQIGMSLTCEVGPFVLVAHLGRDSSTTPESSPTDFDAEDIRRWRAGEWWFGTAHIDVSRAGYTLVEGVVLLSGVPINFGDDNAIFTDAANSLVDEALADAEEALDVVCAELALEDEAIGDLETRH